MPYTAFNGSFSGFDVCNTGSFLLYWLLRLLDRRPAAEDYLLCHTGTLALRVHIVRPGRRHHIFICCVCIDRSFVRSFVRCIAQ